MALSSKSNDSGSQISGRRKARPPLASLFGLDFLGRGWRRLFFRRDQRRRFDWLLPWRSEEKDATDASLELNASFRWFRWPLTARIVSINLLVLVIPLYGFWVVEQNRERLIEAELAGMVDEGLIVAKALGAAAETIPVEFQNFRDDSLFGDIVRLSQASVAQLGSRSRTTMKILTSNIDSRIRLYDLNGDLMVDSQFSDSGAAPIRVEPLSSAVTSESPAFPFQRLWAQITGAAFAAEYREPLVDHANSYPITVTAYNGDVAKEVQVNASGERILLAAIPVQQYRRVIGILLISRSANLGVEESIQELRGQLLRGTLFALGVTILLSIILAGTIVKPIRGLSHTANAVARSKQRSVEIPDLRFRRDEIGDLSFASRKMTEALWDRLDATDAFAADVSHELKNPLTSLKSAIETLQTYPDSPRRSELLEILNHDVKRMDRLITDISQLSRVDPDFSRSDWQPVAILALLEVLVGGQTLSSSSSDGASVPIVLLESKSHDPGDLVIKAVKDRIQQVLHNLIDNARTFSPAGSKIGVRVFRRGGCLRLEVLDQGPGIAKDRLSRVFERFYTDRPESDGFGNHSGLGLSIVKQIVHGHGGKVWAENANQHDKAAGFTGAKFVVEFLAL